MSIDLSIITDNALLPFAGSGAIRLPQGDNYLTDPISIGAIFENGFLSDGVRFDEITVAINGQIYFGADFDSAIRPVALWQDTSILPDGVADAGIWVDLDTARDSVVLTWNGVGTGSFGITYPSTYQVELRDRGGDDAEIIYRFSDLPSRPGLQDFVSDFTLGGVDQASPLQALSFAELDTVTGNTGVAGVWQFRMVDGRLFLPDLAAAGNRLTGTAGPDSLTGASGADTISGLDGNDTLSGGGGQDIVMGGLGDNVLLGGAGNDTLVGDAGNDNIDGGLNDDLIGAGAGNDTIVSGHGNDTIYAADGDDDVSGLFSFGNLLVYGGAGNDSIIGAFYDTLYGGDGDDVLNGGERADTLYGGAGNDTLIGDNSSSMQEPHDLLFGGEGDDALFGAQGNDTLRGDDGQDSLYGGNGRDILYGGDGADIMNGGFGDDSLFGGAGDDFIFGAIGADIATGGSGADRFMVSRNTGDSLRITDYNAAEGDALVLDGTQFAAEELRLILSAQENLSGTVSGVSDVSLVRVNVSGGVEQVLFSFDNTAGMEQLILRLPMPGEAGQVLTLDLF